MLEEIYSDAHFLNENGKAKSCLLLLLCMIDSIAKQKNPTITSQKERYCSYLKSKLILFEEDASYRIEEKGECIHFSEIIYTYFRCFFVHELDDRSNTNYEVQLEYVDPGMFLFDGLTLMHRPKKKFIVKARKLIDLLFKIVESELIAGQNE